MLDLYGMRILQHEPASGSGIDVVSGASLTVLSFAAIFEMRAGTLAACFSGAWPCMAKFIKHVPIERHDMLQFRMGGAYYIWLYQSYEVNSYDIKCNEIK